MTELLIVFVCIALNAALAGLEPTSRLVPVQMIPGSEECSACVR
jgi:hypothetical protein